MLEKLIKKQEILAEWKLIMILNYLQNVEKN